MDWAFGLMCSIDIDVHLVEVIDLANYCALQRKHNTILPRAYYSSVRFSAHYSSQSFGRTYTKIYQNVRIGEDMCAITVFR